MNVYARTKPFQSNEERLVSEALAATQAPAAEIAAIRPPLPQVPLFPERFGYPTVQERAATVEQVIDLHRTYGNRRYATSGGVQDMQGSSRNATPQTNLGF